MIAKSITRTITLVLVIFALLAVSAAGFYFGFTYVIAQNARFDHYDELYGESGFVPDDLMIALEIPNDLDTDALLDLLQANEELTLSTNFAPVEFFLAERKLTEQETAAETDETADTSPAEAEDPDNDADADQDEETDLFPEATDAVAVFAFLQDADIPLEVPDFTLIVPFGANTIGVPSRLNVLNIRFAADYDASGFLFDEEIVEIFIPRGADTQAIAEILQEKEMIGNTFIFNVLSKFNGFDGAYMAGTHFLFRSMNYDEIMYSLVQKPQSVRVTFPEGITYRDVKRLLQAADVNFDEAVLDHLVQNPQAFLDYDFVRQIETRDGRDWLLQGYLYPDTYDFDLNTDEEAIIRTFLNNIEVKLNRDNGLYYERAEQLGMTLDEIMTLASIIQAETNNAAEMRSIAGVYMKRLRSSEYTLSADPTINYIRRERGLDPVLWLSNAQLQQFRNHPYNTYFNDGLPPGPINSPGTSAILAALYPESNDYWYFSANLDGSTAFARNYDEHESNIARYFAELEAAQSQSEDDDQDENE